MTEESKYTKEELKNAERFASKRDLIEALLRDDTEYTVNEADEITDNFLKGSV